MLGKFRVALVAGLLAIAVCVSAADGFRYLNAGSVNGFRSLGGGALLHFAAPESAVSQLTNVQKLSLPANTAVGTRVNVTDGFVESGAGTESSNGFYTDRGVFNGKRWYNLVGFDSQHDLASCYWDGTAWYFTDATALTLYTSTEDVESPWQVVVWTNGGDGIEPFPTLTHPAPQQLAAPSTAQGGVFLSGGTQDGVCVTTGLTQDGKPTYRLLGASADGDTSMCTWTTAAGKWRVYDGSGVVLYYSLSNVATPDLATNWKNASDDTLAGITVTSVTVGELNAGLFVSNDGATNGSSYVSQPFHGRQYYMGLNGGGSNNMHWDTDYNVWTDDAGVWTADNVAFPWQGADNHTGHNGSTFIRNDIANEANWQVVEP